MRILLGVAVSVMHAVQDRVRARRQEARALQNVGRKVEEAFPPLRHRELAVSAEAMQEKGLEEHRQLPMRDEKYQNGQSFFSGAW
jgi:hypothetical protein